MDLDRSKATPMQIRAAKLIALDKMLAQWVDAEFAGKAIPRRLQWPIEFVPSVVGKWFDKGYSLSEKQAASIDRVYMDCDLEEDFEPNQTWPYQLSDPRVQNV